MRRAQTKSSFNGVIDEVPDVSVDNFESIDSRAYFLSHCHTDHTNGLYSATLLNHLKENNYFVYMSKPSAAIVIHESQFKDIANYIRPLEIGSTIITVPGDERNGIEEHHIIVSLIPAGHCFGSVMFLFKTLYKTILYTGDFRISVNSVSKYAQFHEKEKIIKLDALYLDTTFLDEKYDDFPKRSDSVEILMQHVKEWLNANCTNQVALHTSAKYGYEFVIKEIYKNTDQKVYIDEDRMNLYSQFPTLAASVTTKQNETRIHLCRNRFESCSHEKCFAPSKVEASPKDLKSHCFTPIKVDKGAKHSKFYTSSNAPKPDKTPAFLFIHFSALKWGGYQMEDTMIQIKKEPNAYRIDVCFATHCSRSELVYFVSYLSPKKVVGFPNNYDLKGNVETATASKRGAPTSIEKISSTESFKTAKVLDEDIRRKIFAA